MRIMKIHRKRNFLKINNRELQFEREYDSDCSIYKDSQSTDSDSEDEQNMLYVWNKWFTKTIGNRTRNGNRWSKYVHDNHILKIGFNNKAKPHIKSQKHKVCNEDTSDRLAVTQFHRMMGKMLQVQVCFWM